MQHGSMKNMKYALVIAFLTLPTTLYAAGLIPCGGPGEEECQACHLVALGQNILNFLIIIAIALAVVLVAIAGFRMVIAGSNAGQITSARNQLTETIIGLMVLLASWLIVDTLLTYFFAEDRVYGRPWETIQCVKLPEYNEVGGGGVSVTPGPGTTTPPTPGGTGEVKRINAFQSEAHAAGLRAVYEVAGNARKTQLIKDGVTGTITVVPRITAEHFSVYGSSGCGGAASDSLKQNPTCPSCVNISGPSCKAGTGCQATPEIASGLAQINNPDIGNWIVTEGWEPGYRGHSCTCHYIGTCVDVNFR